MKLVFWIVALPLIFIGAFFAVANREIVMVDLWPIADRQPLPLFLALGAAFYLGFVVGAVVAWWAGRRARGRAREHARRAERLAREVGQLESRLAENTAATRPVISRAP